MCKNRKAEGILLGISKRILRVKDYISFLTGALVQVRLSLNLSLISSAARLVPALPVHPL